jgi:hypothetical protein
VALALRTTERSQEAIFQGLATVLEASCLAKRVSVDGYLNSIRTIT